MLIVTAFHTPAGWLEVTYDEHFIHRAVFTDTPAQQRDENALTAVIASEIASFFNNPHHRFQLPLKPHGSLYQQKVWNALLVIPVGRTVTYGELSDTLQSSPRAIGQACKKNPLALFIPCHRVVGKTSLGGYMGNPNALPYKMRLLSHENQRDVL
ncbi:MAG: methylated-DNA--[protein]-cysteine S-methyltransferase [Tatlockia sp.]|jgi:methylated-DNA-[protein]-cysteine S-methyltransferase